MSLACPYPEYQMSLTQATIDKCCEMGARLASEVGLTVRHEKFLESIRGKPGVRAEGEKVYFDRELMLANIEDYRVALHDKMRQPSPSGNAGRWDVSCGGFSMSVIDIESEEIRSAT